MRIERLQGLVLVRLDAGRFDAPAAQALREEVKRLLSNTACIGIDLQDVTLVDSAGLGGLVATLKAATAANVEIALCGLQKPVRAMFELTRMHRVFEIYNDARELERIAAQD